MGKRKQSEAEGGRKVVRKADQLIVTLKDSSEQKVFETRLREMLQEVGLPAPSFLPYGEGRTMYVSCRSRDQAIFVYDFAHEVLDEMPD